ncbi:MAG: hypothetical protein K2Y39_01305 [Candidatus Obscuribacterales bacterium]|nr:hypothetical protein [Candidatus Obscuribacterales bacterium]
MPPEAAPEAAPVRQQASTEGRYDRNLSPELNAKDDAAAISASITSGRIEEALKSYERERGTVGLRGADDNQRGVFTTALDDQLTRTGVLPVLSLEVVKQERAAGRLGDVQSGNIDTAKVKERADALRSSDPVRAGLLDAYVRERQVLEGMGLNRYSDGMLRDRMARNLGDAQRAIKDEQIRRDIAPLADKNVFNAIAGRDGQGQPNGRIEQKDWDAFKGKWGGATPTPEQQAFRNGFGTAQEQARIDRMLKAVPQIDSPDMRRLGLSENNLTNGIPLIGTDNAITAQTLKAGLDKGRGQDKYLEDLSRRSDGRLPQAVEAAPNLDASKIGRGEGPWQVSQRLLRGTEFQNSPEAQRVLTRALSQPGVFDHKQGTALLDDTKDASGQSKRDRVRESIRASGNTDLLKWFDKAYKPTDAAVKPEAGTPAAREQERRNSLAPLADPKLFEAIAGSGNLLPDGRKTQTTRIDQRDMDAFRANWGDTAKGPLTQEQQRFRNQFGTQAQQDRIDKFLKENPSIVTPENRSLGLLGRNSIRPGITRQSLETALGGEGRLDATAGELRRGADGRIRTLPNEATDADTAATRIRAGEGSHQLSQRMLKGADLADPRQAQRDLQEALGTVMKRNDPVGTDVLKDGMADGRQKLEAVREEIRRRGNSELLNWFDARYTRSQAYKRPAFM